MNPKDPPVCVGCRLEMEEGARQRAPEPSGGELRALDGVTVPST